MPKRQSTSDNGNIPRKYARRYPWGDWLTPGVVKLCKGVHYNGRTDTMVQQVRNNAPRHNVTVSIRTADDGMSISVSVTSK